MKVIISTVVMVIVAVVIITKMVGSSKESGVSMDVCLDRHYSFIQAGKYKESYAQNFHKDLQESISAEQYETVWRERIKKLGALQSWEIYTANKFSNLFSGEKGYDVILSLGFVSGEELTRKVYHTWQLEEGEPKLKYTGRRDTASNSTNFEAF